MPICVPSPVTQPGGLAIQANSLTHSFLRPEGDTLRARTAKSSVRLMSAMLPIVAPSGDPAVEVGVPPNEYGCWAQMSNLGLGTPPQRFLSRRCSPPLPDRQRTARMNTCGSTSVPRWLLPNGPKPAPTTVLDFDTALTAS